MRCGIHSFSSSRVLILLRTLGQPRLPLGRGPLLFRLVSKVNASLLPSSVASGCRSSLSVWSSSPTTCLSAGLQRVYRGKAQAGVVMAWGCPRCTYLNQGGGAVCGICGYTSPEPVVDSGPEWSCPTCTFINLFVESSCEMCNTARPELAELERNQSKNGGSRSPAKFRPLRASQRSSNAEKERSQDIDDSNCEQTEVDLQSSLKESGKISRKRKASSVEDEEGLNTNEMDGLAAAKEKFSGVPSGGEVSNVFLGELHMERMARINNSMASSDLQQEIQQTFGQTSGLASDSSAQRRSERSAGPRPTVGSDTVVILTYNVWFREELKLEARMNAIGKIVELRQPHVICFQEVTPNIYLIFQKSSWWNLYECSVVPSQASKKAYFCVLLSRLPVSAFHRNPYNNSVMGRELAMADLDPGPGEQLVVATTHLESPCPAPPSWNQMYSKERVTQASEALKLLKDLPNVIFAGDMNWDEKQDGPPPLPKGWFDAWVKIQPGQPGFTYDSKANPMLGGSRLQRRLDRVFCHLRDFRVKSIEMVGTQAIAGLSYQKEKKVRGQIQTTTLPVLPSDHFGLLLQLQKIQE